jgi:hypothetical protein
MLAGGGNGVKQKTISTAELGFLASVYLNAGRLAVLADMLEEAGCCDPQLLAHLRGPGPHVRGCFAVEAVLGKS